MSHAGITWAELAGWMQGLRPAAADPDLRYNVPPTAIIPIIRRDRDALAGDFARWGLPLAEPSSTVGNAQGVGAAKLRATVCFWDVTGPKPTFACSVPKGSLQPFTTHKNGPPWASGGTRFRMIRLTRATL